MFYLIFLKDVLILNYSIFSYFFKVVFLFSVNKYKVFMILEIKDLSKIVIFVIFIVFLCLFVKVKLEINIDMVKLIFVKSLVFKICY